MNKSLSLGHRIRYPITITKILKQKGDEVKKQEPLMRYSFKWMKKVGDAIRENEWEEEQTTIADWDSPTEGELKEWRIKEGDVILKDQVCIVVREACGHEIQFQGLCAICGRDMTEVNWAAETRDTERAPINMTHDQTSLTVSELQATRAEHELQRRLLRQRKLSLVVDLDQTIIHACIEPTIGEWQRDPTNPNYEAVKDVRSFQLNDEGPRGLATGCSYYIKLRPGLLDFLAKISEMYELHVYTMGTRAYAKNIAALVDPDKKLFGNRVISRDENGSMTAKSLQRIFPVNTNMAVIIDDRADVWPRNRANLIKVTPYDFFKGVGDINSSFLPKREDLLAPPSPVPEAIPEANGEAKPSAAVAAVSNDTGAANGSSKPSALEELASMSSGEDSTLRQLQVDEQEKTLEKQIKDRPMLHMQETLDKQDQEAVTSGETQPGQDVEIPPPPRHVLLVDDDHELIHLEAHLAALHKAYYKEYDERKSRNPDAMPNVGDVLSTLKSQVLEGTTIVLSGLVPLGVDVLRSEIGLQATSFGARIESNISSQVTHLVISSNRPRTQKVRQAARIPSIKIVNQDWLSDTLSQWSRKDETPYLVDVHPADRAKNALIVPTNDTDGDTADESAHHDEDEDDDDLMPADGELSPVDELKKFDWADVDAEYKEFMADVTDDDEDDDEGGTDADGPDADDADGQGAKAGSGTKRKHETDDEDETASNPDGSRGRSSTNSESLLAKKLRVSRERPASSLREVQTVTAIEPNSTTDTDAVNSGLPTPQITGDEDEVALLPTGDVGGKSVDDTEEVDIDDEDLLAELEAEEAEES